MDPTGVGIIPASFASALVATNEEKYKANIKMLPFDSKMKSTLKRTCIVNFRRQSHCPCRNGPLPCHF